MKQLLIWIINVITISSPEARVYDWYTQANSHNYLRTEDKKKSQEPTNRVWEILPLGDWFGNDFENDVLLCILVKNPLKSAMWKWQLSSNAIGLMNVVLTNTFVNDPTLTSPDLANLTQCLPCHPPDTALLYSCSKVVSKQYGFDKICTIVPLWKKSTPALNRIINCVFLAPKKDSAAGFLGPPAP